MLKTGLIRLIALAFGLNLIWEIAHFGLYVPGLPLSKWALILLSSLVDVCIIFIIYALISALFKNKTWFEDFSGRKIFALAILGFAAAVVNEKAGLGFLAWSYAQAMPVIPIINIGLSPLLQLIILPALIFFLVRFFNKR